MREAWLCGKTARTLGGMNGGMVLLSSLAWLGALFWLAHQGRCPIAVTSCDVCDSTGKLPSLKQILGCYFGCTGNGFIFWEIKQLSDKF